MRSTQKVRDHNAFTSRLRLQPFRARFLPTIRSAVVLIESTLVMGHQMAALDIRLRWRQEFDLTVIVVLAQGLEDFLCLISLQHSYI